MPVILASQAYIMLKNLRVRVRIGDRLKVS